MSLYNRMVTSTEDKFELLEKLWARMKSDDRDKYIQYLKRIGKYKADYEC